MAKKNKPMWVVRTSYQPDKDVYLFQKPPELPLEGLGVPEDWYNVTSKGEYLDGGIVCYKHWLAATGLRLQLDKPIRVIFTAKQVK